MLSITNHRTTQGQDSSSFSLELFSFSSPTHFLSTLSFFSNRLLPPTTLPPFRPSPTTGCSVVNRCRVAVNSAVRMPAPRHCSARLASTHNAVNRVNLNMMDTNNWRANQSTEPNMDTSDWRGQLRPESRQRIINKIMDTLKKHLPVSGPEGLHELRRIAQRFEEKIFTVATSQSDYLRKISLKMLTMETKSQSTMPNNIPLNQVGPSNKSSDPVRP